MQSKQRWFLSIVLGMALGFGVTSACRSSSTGWWSNSEVPWQRPTSHSYMSLTNGKSLAVGWVGEVAANAEATRISALPDGGHAEIYSEERGVSRSIFLVSLDGAIRREYRENGALLGGVPDWGDPLEARGIQSTTIGAEERARAILASGGAEALLGEIERIESDGRAEAYLEVLVAEGAVEDLDPEELVQVAFDRVSSSSDRGDLLVSLAPKMVADTPQRASYFDACARISSSSTQCEVIEAAIAHLGSEPQAKVDACRAVQGLSSSSDKTDCLQALESTEPLEGAWLEAWCEAVAGIGSSSSMAECLEGAIRSPRQSDDAVVALIRTSRSVSSSSSRHGLLEDCLERRSVSPRVIEAVLVEAEGLSSSSHTRDVLMKVLDLPDLDRETLDRVTKVTEVAVSSNSDRVEVLERIVERMPR